MGSLTKYFLLTYLASWTFFIPVALLSHNTSFSSGLNPVQQVLIFLGAISPSFVALYLTSRSGIPGQTQILLGRIGRWKVNFKWYVFAAGFLVVIKIIVALLHKLITGAWPKFGEEAWYIIVVAILFSMWVQAGEEIGWRGFALPRMTARFGLSVSTLILGVLWACWHIPLFFIKGAPIFGQSFPLYIIQVTGLSVVIGWLFWRTNGSLLLTMLMHAAVNNTKDIVPSAVAKATNPFTISNSLVAWLTFILLWIFAGYCLICMRTVKELK